MKMYPILQEEMNFIKMYIIYKFTYSVSVVSNVLADFLYCDSLHQTISELKTTWKSERST